MSVDALNMSWFTLNLRQSTVKQLCSRIVRLDNFIAGYAGQFEARGEVSPAQFRYLKFKNLFSSFGAMFADMEFAPKTKIAIQHFSSFDHTISIFDYNDEYGEPLDCAHNVREAYVDDIAAIKTAVAADMQAVKGFLNETFGFKTPVGDNGLSQCDANAKCDEIHEEKKHLYSLINQAEKAYSATLILENLTACLNTGGDDFVPPLAKKN